MIQINLVPDVKLELVRTQRHRRIVISSIVVVLIAVAAITTLLAIYVFVYQNLMKGNNANQIKQLDAQFQSIDDIGKTVTLSNQLTKINETHNETHKTMSSRIFDILAVASSKGTDNSVSITSISMDATQNIISITAQTDNRGFDAADVFRKNIESMTFSYVDVNGDGSIPEKKDDNVQSFLMAQDVSLSDLASGQDDKDKRQKVSFKLTFTYDAKVFSPQISVVSIQGLGKGNVTDSYTRLPQSLFSTSPETEGAKQ
jgi:hypothetical protein